MKTRIISSLVGLAILGFVISIYDTLVLNAAVALICIIGIDELLHGAGYKNRVLGWTAYAFAAVIMFLRDPWLKQYVPLIIYGFAMILMFFFLRNYKQVHFTEIAVTFLTTMLICFSMSTIVACRDHYDNILGLYYNMVALAAAWGTDTCAYFAGRFLGRRKLAPNISPNKTVEGAIGGGIGGALVVMAISYGYALYQSWMGVAMTIHYGQLLIILPFLVTVGMVGDLFASAVKRQYNIKDFGHIMPGHGGVLDRFDSVLTVAPLVYVCVVYLFPLATLG